MKKITLAAFAGTALLALTACSDANAPGGDEAAMGTEAPMTTDTATPPATTTTAPGMDANPGNNVSIDEDGMSVDLNSGDTAVSADIGEDPAATAGTE